MRHKHHGILYCPYAAAVSWQRELVAARIADELDDHLLLVEHEPVITLGSSAKAAHLLLDPEEFERRGITVVDTDRGGDVTYHGPGQVVLYPIVKLRPGERDLHVYLRTLEEVGIQVLAELGIRAFRSEGRTGIWTASGKIAAIGVRVRRWVTSHGLALNVDVDLAAFTTIVPCGLEDTRISCVAQEFAPTPAPDSAEVADRMAACSRSIFGRPFQVRRGRECPGLVPNGGNTA